MKKTTRADLWKRWKIGVDYFLAQRSTPWLAADEREVRETAREAFKRVAARGKEKVSRELWTDAEGPYYKSPTPVLADLHHRIILNIPFYAYQSARRSTWGPGEKRLTEAEKTGKEWAAERKAKLGESDKSKTKTKDEAAAKEEKTLRMDKAAERIRPRGE